MKNIIPGIMIFFVLTGMHGCSKNSDPSSWSDEKINKWFDKGEWLKGWNVSPAVETNRRAFAVSYYKNKERWDKVFEFLKNNDLSTLEIRRFDIDNDNLYATVSEYTTKNEEDAKYEAHRKYIDVQYVIKGQELIGLAPINNRLETLEDYDPGRDIEFLTVKGGINLKADPGRFFLFFPEDAHCPGMKDGENSTVKKIVVKVKTE